MARRRNRLTPKSRVQVATVRIRIGGRNADVGGRNPVDGRSTRTLVLPNIGTRQLFGRFFPPEIIVIEPNCVLPDGIRAMSRIYEDLRTAEAARSVHGAPTGNRGVMEVKGQRRFRRW